MAWNSSTAYVAAFNGSGRFCQNQQRVELYWIILQFYIPNRSTDWTFRINQRPYLISIVTAEKKYKGKSVLQSVWPSKVLTIYIHIIYSFTHFFFILTSLWSIQKYKWILLEKGQGTHLSLFEVYCPFLRSSLTWGSLKLALQNEVTHVSYVTVFQGEKEKEEKKFCVGRKWEHVASWSIKDQLNKWHGE